MNTQSNNLEISKIAYRIDEVSKATSISRSFIYEQISSGKLKITKKGRRTIVLYTDIIAWLRS